jgi:tetratricopeptide (TPR) repeat protein
VSGFVGDLESGGRVANLLTEPSRSATAQVLGHILRAHLQLGLGRLAAARAEIAAAATLDPAAAAEYRALLAAAPFLSTSASELRAARAGLARELPSPPPPVGASVLLTAYTTLHRQVRTYLLGVLSARLGEPTRAARYAEQLERMESPADAGTLVRDLAFGIRAESAWHEKQPGATLAALQQVRGESWYEAATASPFFAESRERFLRGEAYNATGRSAEALEAYSFSGQGSTFDVAYLAPAELRQAEVTERLGRPKEAEEHYARFIELWRGADPELQPMVAQAKSRLAALKRGEGER